MNNFCKDDFDVCEWCNQTYPKGAERYYKLKINAVKLDKGKVIRLPSIHLICGDCYDHLKEVNN